MAAENILLVPGMMCDARLWAPQIDQFDVPVIIADTTHADNFRDMAANVLADAPKTFAIAGLSMGGILAFEIWRQAGERITHMALLDTNAGTDTPERRSLRLQQIEDVFSGKLRELAIESRKPLYLAESNRDNQALLDTILSMALNLGPEVFKKQSLALKDRSDSVPTLATIDCPTTVMCGREDSLCPVSFHELMAAQIPHSRLVVIENSGHLASLERPDVVNNELKALFSQ